MADSPAAAPAGHPVRSPARPLGCFPGFRSSDLVPAPRGAWLVAPAAIDRRQRLIDQLIEDLDRTLLAADQPDTLPGHQRPALDIAVDDRTAERPGPEMLDLELRVLLRELATREPLDDRTLDRREPLGRRVGEGA